MKHCSKCGKDLPESSFGKNKSTKDGLSCYCKSCQCAVQKKYYNTHRDKVLEYQKNYQKENAEKRAKYQKQYYSENKEKYAEFGRKYREEHREENLELKRQYYIAHAEEYADRQKKYRQTEKGKIVHNASQHKRRAGKLGNGGSFSTEEWLAVCAEFDNKCAYCGKEDKLTADHIIPVSKGGTSYISNIIPVCKSCNSSKNNSKLDAWYPRQPFFMPERFEKIMEHSKIN